MFKVGRNLDRVAWMGSHMEGIGISIHDERGLARGDNTMYSMSTQRGRIVFQGQTDEHSRDIIWHVYGKNIL
jgi:hypothetical protein